MVVYNPTAGQRRARRLSREIERCLERARLRVVARPTSGRGDAERIATEAIGEHGSGGVCVVACGGDGTMQEVANAVARANSDGVVMGVAPAGRCNDFARGVGVSGDPHRIVEALVNGRVLRVDLGRVGDRYFCTVAALGFDAAVSRFVNEMRTPLRGAPAYVYGTLRTLLRYRTPKLRLEGDFGRYEGPVFFAASANTPWYGGAMHIAPGANAFDNRLDVCLVGRIGRLRALRLLPRVMTGRHAVVPEVRMLQTRRLVAREVDPSGDVEVWADGEPVTRLPATIESAGGALRVLTNWDGVTGCG